jgi:hypothetical protein
MYRLRVLQEFRHLNLSLSTNLFHRCTNLLNQAADSLSGTMYVSLDLFIDFKMFTSRQLLQRFKEVRTARKLNYIRVVIIVEHDLELSQKLCKNFCLM